MLLSPKREEERQLDPSINLCLLNLLAYFRKSDSEKYCSQFAVYNGNNSILLLIKKRKKHLFTIQ